MGRLVALIVFGFVLFQGYKYAAPWLEQRLGSERATTNALGGDDESARCVDQARRATRGLSDAMSQFARPPVNQQEWTSAFLTVSAEIGAAETACACPSEACDRGYEAASELRDLSLSFDGIARGESRGTSNPARALERVHDLLDEAESLAGI